MTYFEDLTECSYFGNRLKHLIAVGWLERGHPYTTGPAPERFVASLVELIDNAWQPFIVPGVHFCDLCNEPNTNTRRGRSGRPLALGSSNIFVPSPTGVFVAPSLIVHYIDTHSYVPPLRFQEAVIGCPPMGSGEYLTALEAHLQGIHRGS